MQLPFHPMYTILHLQTPCQTVLSSFWRTLSASYTITKHVKKMHPEVRKKREQEKRKRERSGKPTAVTTPWGKEKAKRSRRTSRKPGHDKDKREEKPQGASGRRPGQKRETTGTSPRQHRKKLGRQRFPSGVQWWSVSSRSAARWFPVVPRWFRWCPVCDP